MIQTKDIQVLDTAGTVILYLKYFKQIIALCNTHRTTVCRSSWYKHTHTHTQLGRLV
jgi:hypothetical protein